MTIKQFIEKAIDGGWRKNLVDDVGKAFILNYYMLNPKIMLLDPKAWQAVGKTMGWEKINESGVTRSSYIKDSCPRGGIGKECQRIMRFAGQDWDRNIDGMRDNLVSGEKYRMHQMIDALCEGKSISDYIKTL